MIIREILFNNLRKIRNEQGYRNLFNLLLCDSVIDRFEYIQEVFCHTLNDKLRIQKEERRVWSELKEQSREYKVVVKLEEIVHVDFHGE